ncbi:hypothetical protein F4677DRAFT_465143, partial [Hypoxylon crocopeplum]
SEHPSLYTLIQSLFDKKSLTSEDWTLPTLRKALYNILWQDKVPLYLCFFLDALDEYDGRLEFICQFLKDLGAIPPKPTKRIKVCFSSRPWDIFVNAFQDCGGFRIHDFTKEDVMNYCLGSISQEIPLDAIEFQNLILNIVTRSRGVFIWVKLVVQDLGRAMRTTTMSKEQMERLLESYPTELGSFYAEIINRIPRVYKWKTYAMLEILVRSRDPLTPEDLIRAVECSRCNTYKDSRDSLDRLYGPHTEDFSDLVSQESRRYCGGLIEVVSGSSTLYIQVLHQTVEDFVSDPEFKQTVLGDQARITVENGNTFLTKYDLTDDIRRDGFLTVSYLTTFYTRAAEQTSGRSIKDFLNSIPNSFLGRPLALRFEVATPLGYAVSAGLHLYVIESLADNPNLLRESNEALLSYVVIHRHQIHKDLVPMHKLLLGRGFRIAQDPTAFIKLVETIWSATYHFGGSAIRSLNIHSAAENLFNHGQDPNVTVIQNYYEVPSQQFSMRSPAALLDFGNMTPLDYLFLDREHARIFGYRPTPEGYIHQSYEAQYNLICLISARGGVTNKTRAKLIRQSLNLFSAIGLPIKDLQARLMPPRKSPVQTIKSKLKDVVSRLTC